MSRVTTKEVRETKHNSQIASVVLRHARLAANGNRTAYISDVWAAISRLWQGKTFHDFAVQLIQCNQRDELALVRRDIVTDLARTNASEIAFLNAEFHCIKV